MHVEELWLRFLGPPSIPRVGQPVLVSPTESVPEATEHFSGCGWEGSKVKSQC